MTEKIKFSDIPHASTFVFRGSNEIWYGVSAAKNETGHIICFYIDNKEVHRQGLMWQIPPDYIAAKELLEIYLKNGSI